MMARNTEMPGREKLSRGESDGYLDEHPMEAFPPGPDSYRKHFSYLDPVPHTQTPPNLHSQLLQRNTHTHDGLPYNVLLEGIPNQISHIGGQISPISQMSGISPINQMSGMNQMSGISPNQATGQGISHNPMSNIMGMNPMGISNPISDPMGMTHPIANPMNPIGMIPSSHSRMPSGLGIAGQLSTSIGHGEPGSQAKSNGAPPQIITSSMHPDANMQVNAQSNTLPLIVDIAIDNNGRQLYEVHELHKLVRNQMPRLSSFDQSKPNLPNHLGPVHDVGHGVHRSTTTPNYEFQSYAGHVSFGDSAPSLATSTVSAASFSKAASQDTDIWSDDVEAAFEEVLAIIPKNGLNKIKISGRLCGRNELISDYIFNKTGKFRTRKQVSSHIQVIKNLGQKPDIIRLINEGPTFANEAEQLANNKRFEDIFSKINLNKSLGLEEESDTPAPGTIGASIGSMRGNITPGIGLNVPMNMPPELGGVGSSSMAFPYPEKRKLSSSASASSKRVRRHTTAAVVADVPQFRNFYISVDGQLLLSQPVADVKTLALKENANFAMRFPGLDSFAACPILHNMVRVYWDPQMATKVDTLKSNLFLSGTRGLARVFTCIYSYGKEVLKFNEEFAVDDDREWLVRFWRFFLGKLAGKSDADVQTAFKGLTIKQVVYASDEEQIEVHRLLVRCVLVWEFAKVASTAEAKTTTSRLILSGRDSTGWEGGV